MGKVDEWGMSAPTKKATTASRAQFVNASLSWTKEYSDAIAAMQLEAVTQTRDASINKSVIFRAAVRALEKLPADQRIELITQANAERKGQ